MRPPPKMAALNFYEPQAQIGHSKGVLDHARMAVLIGLGNEVPKELLDDKETFLWRIDPCATPLGLGRRESVYPAEWGDALRLPVAGAYSHDTAESQATASKETLWVGNKRLFPTVYDLMRAAPFCREDTTFALAERGPDGSYVVLRRATNYHPMSGKLPIQGTFTPGEGLAILAAALGLIQMAMAMRTARIHVAGLPQGPDSKRNYTNRIFANDYSTYSVSTAPAVLLISYYGPTCSGMGKTQDRFDRNVEYRRLIYEYAEEVMISYMRVTGTEDPWACAQALTEYLSPGLLPP